MPMNPQDVIDIAENERESVHSYLCSLFPAAINMQEPTIVSTDRVVLIEYGNWDDATILEKIQKLLRNFPQGHYWNQDNLIQCKFYEYLKQILITIKHYVEENNVDGIIGIIKELENSDNIKCFCICQNRECHLLAAIKRIKAILRHRKTTTEAAGLYSPLKNEIDIIWTKHSDKNDVIRTFAHEYFHAFQYYIAPHLFSYSECELDYYKAKDIKEGSANAFSLMYRYHKGYCSSNDYAYQYWSWWKNRLSASPYEKAAYFFRDKNNNLVDEKITLVKACNKAISSVSKSFSYLTGNEYRYNKTFLPDSCFIDENIMRAFPTGRTVSFCATYKAYYRKIQKKLCTGYIGLYANKEIYAVGKIIAVINVVDLKAKKYVVKFGTKPANIGSLIDAAIADMSTNFGTSNPFSLYIVDDFYPTSFRKVSPGGLRNCGKKFDLIKETGSNPLPATADIANSLKGKDWQ